ncbi:hypothetical protein EKD16_15845 [Streptomonospora litoralis]|uniref:Uncharacterized protein n=1 Tax=Streptomonospora litoralis TaxID=2498135 RepID=A0A4P6Q6C9_9ACTN|nr:hypothetical protein EKD16_15845 [Streptomonospora litoralis]
MGLPPRCCGGGARGAPNGAKSAPASTFRAPRGRCARRGRPQNGHRPPKVHPIGGWSSRRPRPGATSDASSPPAPRFGAPPGACEHPRPPAARPPACAGPAGTRRRLPVPAPAMSDVPGSTAAIVAKLPRNAAGFRHMPTIVPSPCDITDTRPPRRPQPPAGTGSVGRGPAIRRPCCRFFCRPPAARPITRPPSGPGPPPRAQPAGTGTDARRAPPFAVLGGPAGRPTGGHPNRWAQARPRCHRRRRFSVRPPDTRQTDKTAQQTRPGPPPAATGGRPARRPRARPPATFAAAFRKTTRLPADQQGRPANPSRLGHYPGSEDPLLFPPPFSPPVPGVSPVTDVPGHRHT